MNPVIITLVLTIVMPPQIRDINVRLAEPSIEKCFEDAKEFLARGTPKQVKNAVGVAAECLVPKDVNGET